jgi:hypothetical protein
MVLDSLQKAGYDSAAIARARGQIAFVNNPSAALGRGGRGGRGGGGRGGAGESCEHPTTQWEQFCARPGESTGGRGGGGFGGLDSATAALFAPGNQPAAAAGRGGRGGRGGRNATQGAMGDASLDPVGRIWQLIGVPQPSFGGRGGGGFGGAGATLANTGDYLVTLSVGGQTYKQTFRIERVSGGSEDTPNFGGDDSHDGLGRVTPAASSTKQAGQPKRQ